MNDDRTTVYILLGANLGDRERNLAFALGKLELIPGLDITATSGIYASEAKGMDTDSPPFFNQVIRGEYTYRPNELLSELESIEKVLGRVGKGKMQPRPIDLDILLFGDEIIETDRLSIPHRELLNRPFAMVPLLHIDPEIEHPVTKRPVSEFLTDKDRETVVLYKDHVPRNI